MMALATYSDLKASVQDWSHRSDVAPRMDDFILIAEQEMYNNRVEPLIVREQEFRATADTTDTSRFLALPDRFTRMRRLLIDDKATDADQFELTFYPPEVLPVSSSSGMPGGFSVTSQIEFNRIPDAVYNVEMQYFGEIAPLNSTNTTNDILTNFPTIYLAGCLWALYRWSKDQQSAASAYDDFIGAIRGANKADMAGRYGPAPIARNERPVI
jgi:hypothetical protein